MTINKQKIRLLMAVNELTTKALAAKIEKSPNNLSTILTRGTCRPETAAQIAKGLGVTVADIVEEA